MPYTTVNVNTEVDIDLDDIDFDDILQYVEDCGYTLVGDAYEAEDTVTLSELRDLYEAYRFNRDEFEKQIANIFYKKIGRIV